MMSKKFIPVVIALTFVSLFVTFKSMGNNEKDGDPKTKHEEVLKRVGILLEEGHFSPKDINDNFSKAILKKFVEELDDEKAILLASDIEKFKKYQDSIDDEINGVNHLSSFYTISNLYIKRLNEVSLIHKAILKNPFDFTIDEKIQMDPEKKDFPKNINERNDLWRKKLKYAVLSNFVDLQEDREKNKDKKDFVVKADSTLEREAREKVMKQMDRYYATKITRENEEDNFSTFINTITLTMDPHTNYFPPIDLRSFNESMSGRFFGIGAQLKEDDGKIKISSLVTGGPAWKSGELKENDELIKVGEGNKEPVDVTGYAVTDAVKLIRGSEKGTEVRLTVRRVDGTIKVISLKRDDIKLEDTFAKSAIIKGENKIGYIYLPEFYADFERPNGARCAVDVAKEVEKLKQEKVAGIILDLRGNGGGSLYDVVKMAGLFIKNGPICQVKGRNEEASILPDKDDRVQYDGPLAVMVDGTSASASEIFAAAIQDYNRGIIIGSSSTYGKGTVQRSIPLNPQNEQFNFSNNKSEDLGNVKLTLQKFYRINGGATQLRGVVPDVVLPDRFDFLKFREKDNVSALPWDQIAKADYIPYSNGQEIQEVSRNINDELKTNGTFNNLKSVVAQLGVLTEKEYSLNIVKYKEEKKQLKDVSKQLEDLNKLPQAMDFQNLTADTSLINSAEDKIEKNKQWIKFRNSDIYIDESVKIMNKMISMKNMARSN